jgi:hypothetical protein
MPPRQVDSNALIALKALQVGFAAFKSNHHHELLNTLDQVIESYKNLYGEDRDQRLAFYLATKAEIARHTSDPTSARQALMNCNQSRTDSVYEWFMLLQEVTESKTGYGDIPNMSPYQANSESSAETNNQSYSPTERMFRAMSAIGISKQSLSSKQINFLENVKLVDILKKHGHIV